MSTSSTPACYLGIDIGGTKCAIALGAPTDTGITLVAERRFPTPATPTAALRECMEAGDALLHTSSERQLIAVGISCGGPLDSSRGLILSPPNLPGWDALDVVTPFQKHFNVPAALQNDANAGALAEWWWGAGQGSQTLIFLTCGTGLGAGLILNGYLHKGISDLAGEVGHLRLTADGPLGYGKAGSFEGWCGGSGIAQLARTMAREQLASGTPARYCPTETVLEQVTAETVGQAAQEGDPVARELWCIVGERLGQGIAMLADLLNPERILLGSIYLRQQALLEPAMRAALNREALPGTLERCQILPAGLGEKLGAYASLAVAVQAARHTT
jgi:Transcriptional regulator/sugar kinase